MTAEAKEFTGPNADGERLLALWHTELSHVADPPHISQFYRWLAQAGGDWLRVRGALLAAANRARKYPGSFQTWEHLVYYIARNLKLQMEPYKDREAA